MEVESHSTVLLKSLQEFYKNSAHLKTLTDILKRGIISLRVVDWLVCNYAKKNNITYVISDQHEDRAFNIYLEYKCQLKSYSKRLMDPFKRHERITITDGDGEEMSTTVSQLNFFRWAIRYKVIDYGLKYLKEIESDMLSSTKKEPDLPKQRRQLSKAAVGSCTTSSVRVRVKFT
jgi:hypothetical protein